MRRDLLRFSPEDYYDRNEDFSLERREDFFYFVHRAGRRVETDLVAAFIWEALPSTAGHLISRAKSALPEKLAIEIRKEGKVLARDATPIDYGLFLETFLYVLYRAEIVLKNGRKATDEDRDRGNLPDESRKEYPSLEYPVSVVVVTYNGKKYIRECLRSLQHQSWNNLEILVVDNASRDGTREIIRNEFPWVSLYSLPKNYHFARAVNFGIRKARGEAIFVLNQDVELQSDCIYLLAKRMKERESKEKVAAVVPMMKFHDLRGFVNGLGNHVRPFGWGSDNFIGAIDLGQFKNLDKVPSACFGAVFLSRQALAEVGLLDEGYGSFYEDTDWSFRAWLGGWKIVPCAEAVVYHHFGGSYEEKAKLRFVVRNRLRFILKIFSGRKRLSFLRWYIIEDLHSILSFIRERHWVCLITYVSSYLSLFIKFPDMNIQRRRFLRKKVKGLNETDVLAMNPERWSFLNERNEPVLNSAIISDYYLRLFFPS